MRNRKTYVLGAVVLALTMAAVGTAAVLHGHSHASPKSCTIFTVSFGDKAFFGNNEDYINPETRYWVVPAGYGHYGAVYFGFDDMHPQGGINEKGLAYDWNGLPEAPLNDAPGLPIWPMDAGKYILSTCATVEEVIETAQRYSWGSGLGAQCQFADATGDAVVISAGADGELAFTRKPKGDGFLVSTNFNLATVSPSAARCWRYNRATSLLSEIDSEDALTVGYVTSILDATHQQGAAVNTVYSTVYDLRNGIIYLYHWHRFDDVVVLNVAEEVAGESKVVRIADLFPEDTVQDAENEYLRLQGIRTPWKPVAWVWAGLTIAALAFAFFDLARRRPMPLRPALAWGLVVLAFGPLGLAAYFICVPRRQQAAVPAWKHALGAAAFSAAGCALVWYVAVALASSTDALTPTHILIATYAVPFFVGLFAFRALWVMPRLGKNYVRALRWSVLTELASVSLASAGMYPVAWLLADLWFPLALDLSSPLAWFLVVLAALAGWLAVYPLNLWMARRRIVSQPLLITAGEGPGEPTLPTFRRIWFALLLSVALFVASLALTILYIAG